MINGVFCHETGCPNSRLGYQGDAVPQLKGYKMNYKITKKSTNIALWNALQFVLRARSNKPLNGYDVDNIMITEEMIIATDTYRMHLTKTKHSFDPGLYEVVKFTKAEIFLVAAEGRFPDWASVVPNHTDKLSVEEVAHNNIPTASMLGFALAKQDIFVSPDFLADSIGYTCYYGTNRLPVKVVNYNETLIAVINPTAPPTITLTTTTEE